VTRADALIDRLGLEAHPEGGYFRETWRSDLELPADVLPDHDGPRSAGTSILFMLPDGARSALHRVTSEELWLYQGGDAVQLTMQPALRTSDARIETVTVGPEPGQQFQAVVPGGWWQAAEHVPGAAGYVLVACVVVPGFDFADFEMA